MGIFNRDPIVKLHFKSQLGNRELTAGDVEVAGLLVEREKAEEHVAGASQADPEMQKHSTLTTCRKSPTFARIFNDSVTGCKEVFPRLRELTSAARGGITQPR